MKLKLNSIYNLDYLEFLKQLDNNSIDCFITSPPYFNVRDYGFKEQIGLEENYNDYLDKLILMMVEMKRALKDTGTIWINLGDSYSTNKKFNIPKKCLMLIPHRFAIRCIDELGLILRNDIIWAKENAAPEPVKDRFSKKHEFVFFFTKSLKYYFDLDSIRNTIKPQSHIRYKYSFNGKYNQNKYTTIATKPPDENRQFHPLGKNPGDVSEFWQITNKNYSLSDNYMHLARYQTEIAAYPILAGCPKNGIVVDPFAGTGTTLFVAYKLKRNFIGNDLDVKSYEFMNKYIKENFKQLEIL